MHTTEIFPCSSQNVTENNFPYVENVCMPSDFRDLGPAVDEASGRYSLWCSALNCKINITSWPSRGTPMKTAYRRLCIAILAIYVHRHLYV